MIAHTILCGFRLRRRGPRNVSTLFPNQDQFQVCRRLRSCTPSLVPSTTWLAFRMMHMCFKTRFHDFQVMVQVVTQTVRPIATELWCTNLCIDLPRKEFTDPTSFPSSMVQVKLTTAALLREHSRFQKIIDSDKQKLQNLERELRDDSHMKAHEVRNQNHPPWHSRL